MQHVVLTRMATKRYIDVGLDVNTFRRYATHASLILLVVAAFFADQLKIPTASALSWFAQSATTVDAEEELAEPLPLPRPMSFLALTKAAVPRTTIPERARLKAIIYKVQPGDTLYGIALKFGVSGETVIWANGQEDNPDVLRVGQEMIIPPVSGVYVTVRKGDTVQSLAARYKAKPEDIIGFKGNELQPPYDLTPGQKIMIPGGEKPLVQKVVHAYVGPVPANAVHGSGIFGWPTSGTISQKFWAGHPAIDIAGQLRSPVYAADGGYVAMAGWSNVGYGNCILIDHGNGFQTLYAHLQNILVRQGQSVTKGQKIGLMGCTGRCTGPHLHFEVRKSGVPRNPLGVLP